MEVAEIIKHSSKDVLKSKELMTAYIDEYERLFGYRPNCAPCTIKRDWMRFVRTIKMSKFNKNIKMNKDRNYIIKSGYNGNIFSYKKPKGRTVHFFGRNMTDEHAENFIEHGLNPTSKDERLKVFETIKEDVSELINLSRKELNTMLVELNLNPTDYKNKKEAVEAIETHEVDDDVDVDAVEDNHSDNEENLDNDKENNEEEA